MESIKHATVHHVPWNKGKLLGQKAPLKQREIWASRIRLQLQQDARERGWPRFGASLRGWSSASAFTAR